MLGAGRKRLDRLDRDRAVGLCLADHHLAVLDVADELGADDVEGAGLGGEDRPSIEVPQHQGANAVHVARADQLGARHGHERKGALEVHQGVDEAV
jgi:hypothetical protein